MKNASFETLNFIDLEIGFAASRSRSVLLPALNAVANRGELVAVIGKNGIGKSTLLRTITGLQPLLGGDLAINGKNIKEYSRIRLSENIGYISTEIVKVTNMKVYDLVSMGRFPYTNWLGRIKSSDEIIINDAILKAGMMDFKERPVTELSDGERQRAMIAMVLAQDAAIMVMDEPTAFLDISSRFEIMHLMHELAHDRNKTIIFSTHDLSTAVLQADKIWLLKEAGLFEGAPEDLMLAGAFKALFDDSKVIFNTDNGSFNIRNIVKGNISVKGKGVKKYWTEKALVRAGYSVDEKESLLEVKIPSEDDLKWKCLTSDEIIEFDSIYELIGWIRDKNLIY